jgi:hypothetical protein
LFQFYQNAVAGLGVQERDERPAFTRPWSAIDEAHAFPGEPVQFALQVVHAEAKVVDSLTFFFEKTRHAGLFLHRFDKLDVRCACRAFEHRNAHAHVRDNLDVFQAKTENSRVKRQFLIDVLYDYSNMINILDHVSSSSLFVELQKLAHNRVRIHAPFRNVFDAARHAVVVGAFLQDAGGYLKLKRIDQALAALLSETGLQFAAGFQVSLVFPDERDQVVDADIVHGNGLYDPGFPFVFG